ncbi:DUF6371 domain-containing protein [Dyadobacter sp. 676]|uniref:DUF6371 domain-containing protein n=1 Tax=Dyadobacter sp. 676 TaxID=3088362 RepID=A0AAU8FPW3_9BACT
MQATTFQYQLKRYKTPSDRVTCPACGAKKSFAPYIDIETGQDLPAQYGRCNRADQCGYHLNPYKDGYGTAGQKSDGFVPAPISKPKPTTPPVNLPKELLVETLKKSPGNRFTQHLLRLFPQDVVNRLRSEYMIGDHDVWPGSTMFWFVNKDLNIRAGQVKQFDETGHTAKNSDGTSRTVWIHKLVPKETEWLSAYETQDMRVDCLFGEHLLNRYPDRKIALFESPKTAIIATPFFPEMLCLAVGALDYLTPERVQALRGKTVILYPDLSKEGKAFAKWSEKAERLRPLGDFKVSSFLEQIATDEERAKGLDMADYLERMDYKPRPTEDQPVVDDVAFCGATAQTLPTLVGKAPAPEAKPEPFDIAEYREWFSTKEMPKSKIILNDAVTIYNLEAFVKGRLNHISAFTGQKDQGNRPQFIRQLKYIRKYFQTLQ